MGVLLGLYVTSNVVKLMCIAYFSLLSLTMVVFCVCVKDTLLILYMLIFKSCLCWALVHRVTFSSPPALDGYQ